MTISALSFIVSNSQSALQTTENFDSPCLIVLCTYTTWAVAFLDFFFFKFLGHDSIQGHEQADSATQSAIHDFTISCWGILFMN